MAYMGKCFPGAAEATCAVPNSASTVRTTVAILFKTLSFVADDLEGE